MRVAGEGLLEEGKIEQKPQCKKDVGRSAAVGGGLAGSLEEQQGVHCCWKGVEGAVGGQIPGPYGLMERMLALILGVLGSWGLPRGEGGDLIQVTNAQSCRFHHNSRGPCHACPYSPHGDTEDGRGPPWPQRGAWVPLNDGVNP